MQRCKSLSEKATDHLPGWSRGKLAVWVNKMSGFNKKTIKNAVLEAISKL